MTIENIDDHRALACDDCGSVAWALLKSGQVECLGCQVVCQVPTPKPKQHQERMLIERDELAAKVLALTTFS